VSLTEKSHYHRWRIASATSTSLRPHPRSEYWIPLHATGQLRISAGVAHNLYGVARLKDGVTRETALSNANLGLHSNWNSSIRTPTKDKLRKS